MSNSKELIRRQKVDKIKIRMGLVFCDEIFSILMDDRLIFILSIQYMIHWDKASPYKKSFSNRELSRSLINYKFESHLHYFDCMRYESKLYRNLISVFLQQTFLKINYKNLIQLRFQYGDFTIYNRKL